VENGRPATAAGPALRARFPARIRPTTPSLATFETVPPEPLLAEAADAYLAAFARAPYRETEADREAFVDRVRRYSGRDGFRLVLARSGDAAVGVGLGVVAHAGDWWRDRVAEECRPEDVDRWLGDACLEFVHLAVRPEHEGAGIGGAIHDAVLAGAPAPTAVLTVDRRAERARRLYDSRGWEVLQEGVTVGEGEDLVLMGRLLQSQSKSNPPR
jgi:GNAT superfamily N-acetyltransferase